MPTIPGKDIRLLIKLQEKDKILDDLGSQLKAIPGLIQEMRDALEEKKELAEKEKEALTKVQVSKKEREIELNEKEDLIRKHQVTLNQIKSNDAFKALLLEIENAKKAKDDIETGIIQLLEEIDLAVKNGKKISQEIKEIEAKNQKDISELEAKKSRVENELKSLESDRTGFCSQINSEALSRYEYLQKQKNGLAVVATKQRSGKDGSGGASCGGCNIALTPQSSVDLKKKDVLVICDNCQRIIYSKEHLAKDSENGSSEASKAHAGTPINPHSGEIES